MLLFTTVFPAMATMNRYNTNTIHNNYVITGKLGKVLDQSQIVDINYGWVLYESYGKLSQSFVPTLREHTDVRLKLFDIGYPQSHEIVLSIREELDGEDLGTASIDSDHLAVSGWKTFSFEESINLTPGKTHYLVLEAKGGSPSHHACWFYYARGEVDKYVNGKTWDTFDGEWKKTESSKGEYVDCCFMTYCINNPPETPYISGPQSGEPEIEYTYTIATTDADNHNVSYFVEWGDGETQGWSDSQPSGEEIQLSHTWAAEGTYTIQVKARDVDYKEESDWALLEVSMPKNKEINLYNCLINRLIQQFPILQKLL